MQATGPKGREQHPAAGDLLAYAEERAAPETHRRVHAHLALGCRRCSGRVTLWRRSLDALQARKRPPPAPRDQFLQQAMTIFDELAPPPSLWNQVITSLAAGPADVEEAAEETDALFRVLFARNPLAMWLYDLETLRFLEVNDAALAMLGYSRSDFLRTCLSEVLLPDEWAPGPLETSGVRRQRYRALDGRTIDGEVRCHHLTLHGRRVALAAVQDVTERLALEEQLRQSQRMDAIGRLAAGVAHDFNNLLAVVVGYAEVMKLGRAAAAKVPAYATEIHQAAQRAAALTRQLLAFSRKQVLRPQVVDLNEIVAGMERMLRRVIGVDIDLVVLQDPNLASVAVDPGQMDQVILNLVVNARDAMPDGGRLTIETANVRIAAGCAARSLAARPGSYVRLRVSDSGCGMDAETRRHIFEPFFTTKEEGKGTGLGLATVFGIVKQSNGEIEVHSEPGNGTTFDIYLPQTGDTPGASPEAAPEESAAEGTETILVAEDEESVRQLVCEVLAARGYQVLPARDGAEALALSRDHHGPVHLVLTDVMMPGMSGPTLVDHLRAERSEIRALYMSANAEVVFARRGESAGDVPFIQKPFSPRVLAAKVREVIDGE
jgi:PAS domain S-box-containing protein